MLPQGVLCLLGRFYHLQTFLEIDFNYFQPIQINIFHHAQFQIFEKIYILIFESCS